MKASDDPGYDDARVNLASEVKRPSYEAALEWMEAIPKQKAVSFDFWNRGNYTRHLLYNRARSAQPLIVRISNLAELKAAYRRLTLLGIPMDFVYSGNDCWSGYTMSLLNKEHFIDSGWGYMCAAGSEASIDGGKTHDYAPIMGSGTYLPDPIVDWVITEGREAFNSGSLSVAPAASVGIVPMRVDSRYNQLAGIAGGLPLTDRTGGADVLLSLDLPVLDGLSTEGFREFLADNRAEVHAFRGAFGDVMQGTARGPDGVADTVAVMRREVENMRSLVRRARIRTVMAGVESVATVSTVTLSLMKGANPAILAGSVPAAALALTDLYLQLQEQEQGRVDHSYGLLWRLGAHNPHQVRTPPPQAVAQTDSTKKGMHWLCPPTPGMMIPTYPRESNPHLGPFPRPLERIEGLPWRSGDQTEPQRDSTRREG